MNCVQKTILLKEYRATVGGYVRIIKRMKTKTPQIAQVDFAILQAEAKDCLWKSKAAQRALQLHVTAHHC